MQNLFMKESITIVSFVATSQHCHGKQALKIMCNLHEELCDYNAVRVRKVNLKIPGNWFIKESKMVKNLEIRL